MKTKNVQVKTSRFRKWVRRILITLAVIVLVPLGLFTIGWLNRDTIINRLQEWYSENNSGTLTIGKVNANFLDGFPNVGFTLKDIHQTNTDTISDRFSSLQIEEAKLVIGAGNLLRGNIQFNKISLRNVIINSEVITNRPFAYHEQLQLTELQNQKKGLQLPVWINPKACKFSLENVIYIDKNSILNKYFNLEAHQIKGSFKGENQILKGVVSLDVTANNLGFNTKKGSFSNGARIKGQTKFKIDLINHRIDVDEFPLHIDNQTFEVLANFDLSDTDSYAFQLQNNETDFQAVKSLLTDTLAAKIINYNIQKPFKTKINLNGTFAYGNDPDVLVIFSTEKNDIIIAKDFHFKNVDFSGYLTTDIYTTDSLRLAKRSGKDVKISFDAISADLDGIDVKIKDAYYQSTPEIFNLVKADVNLKGSNEALTKVIEMDNFDFKGGNFQLDVSIFGDIPNAFQFLNTATGDFSLKNTQISLKKNGLQLPIQAIDLNFNREDATLKQLIVNLPNEENLVFTGIIKNISGIISKTQEIPTTSQIRLNANNLNLNEVLSMAKSFIPNSGANLNDRKTLYETLEAVYGQFHPQFKINLEALTYNDVTITELKSTIDLVNSNTIRLRNFDFKYDDASTNLKGRVMVPGPESKLKDAIYMDAEATSSGPITVFRDLFNIELFRIDAGDFMFHGNVTGNINKFSELMNNARGDLKLINTKLFYEPAEMEIGIDSLALFVNKGDILLDKFDLDLGELYPINLSGIIRNFPSFLLENGGQQGSIKLNVGAAYVDGNELLATINSFKNKDSLETKTNKKALHKVFKDINKFNPLIELAIDSLKYKSLITEQIKAQVYFENDSIFKLKYLDLVYKNSTATIEGKINAHTSAFDLYNDNPFNLDFKVRAEGKSEDLNDYLKNSNFFFRSGDFEFEGRYEAQADAMNILNAKTYGDLKISRTLVDYSTAGLMIPIDSLHVSIEDDLATLKTLDINLPGKSSIEFTGSITNFSDFIDASQEENLYNSDFKIYSPYLDTSDIKKFLEDTTTKKDSLDAKVIDLQKLKDAMTKINTAFYPTLAIDIDTLRHKDFKLTDFGLNLLYDAQGNFKIEDTQLNFYGGSITMNAKIGLAQGPETPITLVMNAKDIDFNELVTRFDYFNDEDLKNTEKIEGKLNYNVNATGKLDAEGQVDMSSLNGIFNLDLYDFELFNYKPVMENSVMMKDERFRNLRFRPIVQTFQIKDGVLIIPRTEIQSSAIHVFIEGQIKFNDYMNIWLSIPWKNLKANDGLSLPEKTDYKAAGSKFFVQLLQDKSNEKPRKQKLKVKVRLSNRKLRKQK